MRADHVRAVLKLRPPRPAVQGPSGLRQLAVRGARDALLLVPEEPPAVAPLIVSLHGAGGNAEAGLSLVRKQAEAAGAIVLAPASRSVSWDVIVDGYGQDVETIDRALQQVFGDYTTDPAHTAIAGFSDGASYALSLGLSNGTLFSHVIAFSPGFMAPMREEDSPAIFVAHGTADDVLPIGRCSRRLIPKLRAVGLNPCYREFAGAHVVPTLIRQAAFAWFLTGTCPE